MRNIIMKNRLNQDRFYRNPLFSRASQKNRQGCVCRSTYKYIKNKKNCWGGRKREGERAK